MIGLTQPDIAKILAPTKHKAYRSDQIFSFLHKERGRAWGEAEALPKDMREWLEANCRIDYGRVLERAVSDDRMTARFVLRSPLGSTVETVLIQNQDTPRSTLCVSSQAGCSLSCTFCATGAQKFEKNLKSEEIIAQYLSMDESSPAHPRPITNIVFMGQGEPLYNWRNVASAISILTSEKGLNFPRPRITISTSGIAPLIPSISAELGVSLAVSLHAANDDLRSRIMPINRTYPLHSLMEACRMYAGSATATTRRITFEYVMLDGVNDDPQTMVPEIVQLMSAAGLQDFHFNLLPFNEWPGAPHRCSPLARIDAFKRGLLAAGVPCTVRTPKGRDIMAACGQLKGTLLEGATG